MFGRLRQVPVNRDFDGCHADGSGRAGAPRAGEARGGQGGREAPRPEARRNPYGVMGPGRGSVGERPDLSRSRAGRQSGATAPDRAAAWRRRRRTGHDRALVAAPAHLCRDLAARAVRGSRRRLSVVPEGGKRPLRGGRGRHRDQPQDHRRPGRRRPASLRRRSPEDFPGRLQPGRRDGLRGRPRRARPVAGGRRSERIAPLFAGATPTATADRHQTLFFVGHGTADRRIPFAAAVRARAELARIGVPTAFHAYPGMGHAVGIAETADLSAWLSNQSTTPPPP